MSNKTRELVIAGLTTFGIICTPTLALANTTQTVFYVSTNGRDGRVNYDIHLNSDCSPTADQPVYNYYRKTDGSTRPLNSQEQDGYRISRQSVSGNNVNLILSSFQHYGVDRPITIISSRLADRTCQARAFATIGGEQAQLAYAHVEVNRTQLFGQTVGVQLLAMSLVGSNQQQETFACQSNCEYGF